MITEKTYVHDGIEVKLTGRKATRTIGITSNKKVLELVEIQPLETILGKQWVKMDQLYEIEEK